MWPALVNVKQVMDIPMKNIPATEPAAKMLPQNFGKMKKDGDNAPQDTAAN